MDIISENACVKYVTRTVIILFEISLYFVADAGVLKSRGNTSMTLLDISGIFDVVLLQGDLLKP